jgi:hypothetical protein
MHEIQASILALLPPKRKSTSGGWTSFNAICCHHKGESRDNRMRGGVKTEGDAIVYHCFNCGFAAGWSPGKLLTNNTRNLLSWLGMPSEEILKLAYIASKNKTDVDAYNKPMEVVDLTLVEKPLPENSKTLVQLASETLTPEDEADVFAVFEYLVSRGMELEWYNWMWSPAPGYRDRLLIPFYHEGKVVGYTGRKIAEGKPKYLTSSQKGYVFNIDNQDYSRNYVIVVEGQIDAIAIDGVGIMTNRPTSAQIMRINSLAREVIVVPDRDKPGAEMVKFAIENEWSASLPPWWDNVKDVADAVKKYGRVYVLSTILNYKVSGKIKLNHLKNQLEKITDGN